MSQKISVAVITGRISKHRDAIADMVAALQEGGFLIHGIKEWEKTKEGNYVTWIQIEKAEMAWCNVCQERTISHRLRCERCGAKRSSY